MKKKILIMMTLLVVAAVAMAGGKKNPTTSKREFRGAWIQCVNGQYLGKTPQQLREMLAGQLDVLQKAGINVIMFQCRAEGDALYRSQYEPWSRYLTGQQGLAPEDGWDPLGWMVDECHKRGMECHAWINPYRAKTAGTKELDPQHAAVRYPNRIFKYGDLYIFDPSQEVNRAYTCVVVQDILEHYDVDGLHIDDYFYPYPVAGQEIPDAEQFRNDPRGFKDIEDWRRDNVNKLIHDLYNVIREEKPWVKFGVSPFGIYRNSKSGVNEPEGSATSGLQNYDQLYADIKLWVDKGWVDYLVPQIYWNFGTKAADYGVLCHWWNDYCSKRPLVIGQDVERTVKGVDENNPKSHQMVAKYTLQRSLPNIKGSCQWYAAAVVQNPGNYRTMLEQVYHKNPTLQPEMKFISKAKPGKPQKMQMRVMGNQTEFTWGAKANKNVFKQAHQYAVYIYNKGEKVDLNDGSHLKAIVSQPKCVLNGNLMGKTIVVTSLNRIHNESKGRKIKL